MWYNLKAKTIIIIALGIDEFLRVSHCIMQKKNTVHASMYLRRYYPGKKGLNEHIEHIVQIIYNETKRKYL